MQSSRRRLPSLHSIGRSRCVDLDELPSEPAWVGSGSDNEEQSTSPDPTRPSNSCSRPATLEQGKFDTPQAVTENEIHSGNAIVSEVYRRAEFPLAKDSSQPCDEGEFDCDVTTPESCVTESLAEKAEWLSQVTRCHFRKARSDSGRTYQCPNAAAASCSDRTHFRHVTHYAKLSNGLHEVEQLLIERARLELFRHVASQVRSAALFVSDLRQLFDAECRTWNCVGRNQGDDQPITTRLEQLHLLVDELRGHMGRWAAVRRQLLDFRRLSWRCCHSPKQRTHGQVSSMSSSAMVDGPGLRLVDLTEAAIVWIHRIVEVGFRNLAHCDLERISQETLWNIARGLEQFNLLMSSNDWYRQRIVSDPKGLSLKLLSKWRRMPTEPISVSTVLHQIADERSKYAAASIRETFAGNCDFRHLLARSRLPLPSWERLVNRDLCGLIFVQTSDYGASSVGHSSDSSTRLRDPERIHRFGGDHATCVNVPDLVGYPSPLIDFNRRESTFAARFIEIICRSTGLIRFPLDSDQSQPVAINKSSAANRSNEANLSLNKSFDNDADGCRTPPDSLDTCCRKTVSWGDASLAVAAKQTMRFYMHAVWHRFSAHLFEFLVTMDAMPLSSDRRGDRFDSVILYPDTAALVLQSMIQRCSCDEKYPLNSRPALIEVSLNLFSLVAWHASDSAFGNAAATGLVSGHRHLSSSATTTLLVSDRYKMSSGRLAQLGDAILPLLSVVQQLGRTTTGSVGQQTRDADPGVISYGGVGIATRVLYPSIRRLLAICDAAVASYQQKSAQLVASRDVENYLAFSLEDLQMLTADYHKVMSSCPLVISTPQSSQYITDTHLKNIWSCLTRSVCQLETFSGSNFRKELYQMFLTAAKEFFLQKMPSGKEWRHKNGDVCPVQHSDYIEHAMEVLVQPVITATSRFKPDAQFLTLSTVISALCEAWTSSILSRKIRFSYLGACQLEFDVLFTKTWLDSYVTDSSVRVLMTSHDALNYMDSVTTLLKQQPAVFGSGKGHAMEQRRDKVELKNNNGRSHDEAANNGSTSDRWKLAGGDVTSGEDHSVAWRQVPYTDQWLALRVQGTSRSWSVLTSCFNNTNVTES